MYLLTNAKASPCQPDKLTNLLYVPPVDDGQQLVRVVEHGHEPSPADEHRQGPANTPTTTCVKIETATIYLKKNKKTTLPDGDEDASGQERNKLDGRGSRQNHLWGLELR